MRGPRSLQLRLALALGGAVLLLWLAAAAITAERLRQEMHAVFDAGLADTAHRILPLVLRGGHDHRDRFTDDAHSDDDDGRFERIQRLPETEDAYSYVVFDPSGRVILSSEDADPAIFPPYTGDGFAQTGDYRFFIDRARRSGPIIAVAEPLSHRDAVARQMAMRLSLPLLAVVPLILLAIFLVVRGSLAPVRHLRDDLGDRGARNLAPLPDRGLPSELTPVVGSINALLTRLNAAFEAERSFAANAAHELRTPVAGAIAQAQRLRVETGDANAAARATEIESTLKRLNNLSEKLMQLARAEGARLRRDSATDLRPILRMVADDFGRLGAESRIDLTLPDHPVPSDLDPDAFGILARNLIENALKHGAPGTPVRVVLDATGILRVINHAPVIPPDDLAQLTDRFARSNGTAEGSGLGLAIVRTIADRADAKLTLHSPAPGLSDGVEVRVNLP
ncbi:sensor histidine kinase [Rhodovulum adriaticum]|uniref:histidine kinase n=1 Tax=Rhodovulum adriaticum TaxID=35804 RepID=A0A4R2NK88_RHOAD|nr:ATP-binding protein [Rhodovulum adriaticum]MBK1637204.1 two-component sensor histidine kinase [Rhodovulum adriaticum]TCP21963.1 two-component system OmpR family sensor kinase [Rhodovulum adriaticum]